ADPEPEFDGPPSAQRLSDLNTYLIGLLKLLTDTEQTHEGPELLAAVPALRLHLSNAFREVQAAYSAVQAKYPDVPTLPGAGSLLAAPEEPEAAPGEAELADLDPAADAADPDADPGMESDTPGLEFGDDFDDAAGDLPETEPESDDDDGVKEKKKGFREAMARRSEKV